MKLRTQLLRDWAFIWLFLLISPSGLATHYKGGQVSWTRTASDPPAQTVTVEFAIVLAMDRSEFPVGSGTAPDGRPDVNDEVQDPKGSAELFFGDGTSHVICNMNNTGEIPLKVIAVEYARNLVLLAPVTPPLKTYTYLLPSDRWTSVLKCALRDSQSLNLPETLAGLSSVVSVHAVKSPKFLPSNPHILSFDRIALNDVATFSFQLEADPTSPNRNYRLPTHSEITASGSPGTTCTFGDLEFFYIEAFSTTQVTLSWHLGGLSTFNRRFPPNDSLECTSAVAQIVAEEMVGGVVEASACIEFQVSVNEKAVHYNTLPIAR